MTDTGDTDNIDRISPFVDLSQSSATRPLNFTTMSSSAITTRWDNINYLAVSIFTNLQLNTAASNARGDDVHRLKEIIIDWISETEAQRLSLSKQDRSGRWLHHDVTARLLCPISYDWDNLE